MIPGIGASAGLTGLNAGSSMREVVHGLGLTSGLKLLLDAGDNASYSSGQTWTDLSGNGYDFYRGTGSGSDSADPTFNGTAGGRSSSEYWLSGTDDKFTYDSTNETWMNNLHKDGAAFSFAGWYWPDGAFTTLINTGYGAFQSGISVSYTSSRLAIDYSRGSDVLPSGIQASLSSAPSQEWTFISGVFNESLGTLIARVNGQTSSAIGAYSSPSSSNASSTMVIGATGFSLSTRLASFVMWEGVALSATQLANLFNATRGKFAV